MTVWTRCIGQLLRAAVHDDLGHRLDIEVVVDRCEVAAAIHRPTVELLDHPLPRGVESDVRQFQGEGHGASVAHHGQRDPPILAAGSGQRAGTPARSSP